MATINFQTILNTLKDEVTSLAATSVKKYTNEAKSDALSTLDHLKGNLETWTLQLASGDLSKKDFEFLILAQKELIQMVALKQAGLALIQVDEFKNALLNQIVNTVFKLL